MSVYIGVGGRVKSVRLVDESVALPPSIRLEVQGVEERGEALVVVEDVRKEVVLEQQGAEDPHVHAHHGNDPAPLS